MRPGRRLVQGLVLLAAASLAAPLAPWLPPAVGAAALALLGAALGEALFLRRIAVEADRPAVAALPLDEETAVGLRLHTNAGRPVRLTVRQTWPRLVGGGSSTRAGVCRPGEALAFSFPVRGVARGAERWEPPDVAVTVWGLAERRAAAGGAAEVCVMPNLRAVRRLHRRLNAYALRGLGSRASPRLGKGREFDRLRQYVIDDDYRDIAWKASARHDTLIVREWRLDRSQDVLVCIDRGHRMAARVTRITKVDHAVNAAVLVSYVCHRMEDRVGMLSFGSAVESGVPQGRGAVHLRQLTAFATIVHPEWIHTDYLALAAHVRRRLRHRALILLLTDLPEGDHRHDLRKAVRLLAPQHLPLVMVVSDPDLRAATRLAPANHDELCRTLVARDVWTARQEAMQELRRSGALVVETVPEDLGVDAINAYIDVKRRQLL